MLTWKLKEEAIVRLDDIILKVVKCRKGEVHLGVECSPHVKISFENPPRVCDNTVQGNKPCH